MSAEGVLPPDAHPWRAALLLGALVVAAGMAYSLWLAPLVTHCPCWWHNTEAWAPFDVARYVANGAYPFMYDGSTLWVGGPILPVLLAPAAALADHFRWTEYPAPYPSAWLVYAPLALASAVPFLYSARSLAHRLRPTADHLRLQVALTLGVLPAMNIVFLHVEDTLALTFVFLSIRDHLDRRWVRSALFMGSAMACKQWALLVLPAMVVAWPPQARWRSAGIAMAVPLALIGIPLVANPGATGHAVFGARAFPGRGHSAIWLDPASHAVVTATLFRTALVLIAAVLAWRSRRRVDTSTLLAIVGVVFVIRMLVEPVIFAYYLAPALSFLALHRYLGRGTVALPAALGVVAGAGFLWHPAPWIWWTLFVAACAALAVPALVTLLVPLKPRASLPVESSDGSLPRQPS